MSALGQTELTHDKHSGGDDGKEKLQCEQLHTDMVRRRLGEGGVEVPSLGKVTATIAELAKRCGKPGRKMCQLFLPTIPTP